MSYIYDLTDTWNAGGTVFTAIKMNVTNSASASGSKVISLQVNGTEQFSVDKDGKGYVAGNLGIGTSGQPDKLFVYANTASSALFVRNDGGGPLQTWATFGTERMRLDSSGNLGIGTSSPGAKLDVAGGDIYVRTGGRVLTDTVQGYSGLTTPLALSAAQTVTISTASTERMRIDSSGNVGIGTSSPSLLFQVSTRGGMDSSGIFYWGQGLTGNNRGRLNWDTDKAIIETPVNLVFSTNNTERARIDASGNLLVGTTSNSATAAILHATSATDSKAVGAYAKGTTSAAVGYYCKVDSSSALYAYWNCNGVNTGSISTNGTTTAYNTSSDARLKENIAPADDASALIDQIKVRKFDWKADGSHQRYGMVAQELLEVAPEAVSVPTDEEQMMGVDYSKLVPMLVKEIQSLRARVAQLEGK